MQVKSKMRRVGMLLVFLSVVVASRADNRTVLRMATTTSTYESGLLDRILPTFESKRQCKVHVVSVGTGKAMALARNGDVDVVLVHARAAEDAFISEGYGVNRRDVMVNDFVLLGPAADPADGAAGRGAVAVLKRIAAGTEPFVSRGDDSGTHKREKNLWKLAGLKPAGPWYMESGQGMSATLRMADEKNAYVLVDRATYLSHRRDLRLELLTEGDASLLNPYGIIAVSPYRHPHVKYELAMALIAWVTSPRCQDMIGAFKVEDTVLFRPNAAPESE